MSKIGGDALTDGASVNQWELTGNDTQKWIFTHDGYGYYTIHQVNGSQLLCMNVENNSTALNEDIVLSYEGIFYFNDPTLWKISVTSSGAFKLTAKQSESLGYVLATSTSSQTSGARLIQDVYFNDTSYCDEWEIISLSMALFGIPDGSHDHSTCLENIRDMGKWSSCTLGTTALQSVDSCKTALQNHDVFIIRAHGNYLSSGGSTVCTRVLLNDGSVVSDSQKIRLYSHYYSSMNSVSSYLKDTENYSNLDMSVFVACYSGYGGPNEQNLPSKIVDLGTEVAIGFKTDIDCADANTWTVSFWDAMLNGSTVQAATELACEKSNIPITDTTICGNANYTLVIH